MRAIHEISYEILIHYGCQSHRDCSNQRPQSSGRLEVVVEKGNHSTQFYFELNVLVLACLMNRYFLISAGRETASLYCRATAQPSPDGRAVFRAVRLRRAVANCIRRATALYTIHAPPDMHVFKHSRFSVQASNCATQSAEQLTNNCAPLGIVYKLWYLEISYQRQYVIEYTYMYMYIYI